MITLIAVTINLISIRFHASTLSCEVHQSGWLVPHLREVELSIPECAAGEFARLCWPQPGNASERRLHSARHRRSAVDMQLRNILAREAAHSHCQERLKNSVAAEVINAPFL